MNAPSIYQFSRQDLEDEISNLGFPEKKLFYAKEIFKQLYKNLIDFENKSLEKLLNKQALNWFQNHFNFETPVAVDRFELSQQDTSVKFVMKLKLDGLKVETILIPERKRLTLCISTQVGCAQACRFCQTGTMGLLRQLTCDEIVGQLLAVQYWMQEHHYIGKITNIVYMGMGEPLDNLNAVIKSTSIFCDSAAFFLSHNKITVSTVGMLPQLNEILLKTPISLALSLHSPFEEERSKIMPVNLKHSLTDIINSLKGHLNKGIRKSFLIQYTLIRGVNDSTRHSEELIKLLAPYPFKVNLIPLNEHKSTSFRRPDLEHVYNFQQNLKKGNLVATIRLSKGRDIGAACGQLINGK